MSDAPAGSAAEGSGSMLGLQRQGAGQGLGAGRSLGACSSSGSAVGAGGSGVERFIRGFDSAMDSELDALYPPLGTGFEPPPGFEDGTTWLIMDFCDSGTLQVRQGSGPGCEGRAWRAVDPASLCAAVSTGEGLASPR